MSWRSFRAVRLWRTGDSFRAVRLWRTGDSFRAVRLWRTGDSLFSRADVWMLALSLGACVPSGSAPPYDAGPAPSATANRPSLNVMTAPFEDNFDRPDGAAEPPADAAVLLPGPERPDGARGKDGEAGLSTATALFADGAAEGAAPAPTGPALGTNWVAIRTNAWRIENGQLCGQNAHNHPVWLTKVLPQNARIEFDAVSFSDEGDLKAEVWGDGRSAASGASYNNATSYLTIFGGWKNTTHGIARLDEHGKDRKVIQIDRNSDDPRERPVVKGQVYRFKVERTDGKTVRWSVDGLEMLNFVDAQPLVGEGHDHFGFNEWEAKVCFDNVKVTPL